MRYINITETCRTFAGEFHEGELRCVDDRTAGLLIGNGWATEAEDPLLEPKEGDAPEDVTLDVQSVKMGIQSEEVADG